MERPSSHASRKNTAPHSGTCTYTAVIGSMTKTMSAENALSRGGIRTSVIKVSSADTGDGCAYGLVFPCSEITKVKEILGSSRIKVRKFIGV